MDLPLSDDLYLRYRDLLLARTGLHYPERRRPDLVHALSQAALCCGFDCLTALYRAIIDGGPVWDLTVAQLTIGETYFMRNGAQFAGLRTLILPDLTDRRRAARSLRIWSAGCATGEEPYSLAMTLADALPVAEGWQISILATDINSQFLERAREALYGSWSFREMSEAMRDRFFTAEGSRWRLHPELRRQVLFARLNLAEPGYPTIANGTVALDLIFCRNVTIYFDEATTRQVVERFYMALAPGGWLVVGHAEPHNDIYRNFETHNAPGAVLYRKPLSAPAFISLNPALPPIALPSPQLPTVSPALAPPPRVTGAYSTSLAKKVACVPSGHDLLEDVRKAANRGDWEAAQAAAEAALGVAPLNAEIHYLLGQVYEHIGDLEDALAAYRRSVYLDAGWVLGTLGMAGIWRQTHRLADARRSYRSALYQLSRLDPKATVPGTDRQTSAELVAYIHTQLDLLSSQVLS